MTRKFAMKPHFRTPRRVRKTPTLTLREMAEKTPPATRKRSNKVAILRVKKQTTLPVMGLKGWTTYILSTKNMENKHEYRVTIFAPQDNVMSKDKVIVDSECPLHVFRYEYSLAKRGNAFIYRSNGDPPLSTNPSMRAGVDHHVYAAFKFLLRATKKYKRLTPKQVEENNRG